MPRSMPTRLTISLTSSPAASEDPPRAADDASSKLTATLALRCHVRLMLSARLKGKMKCAPCYVHPDSASLAKQMAVYNDLRRQDGLAVKSLATASS